MTAAGTWLAPVSVAAVVAVVELDAVQVGQVMISRPVVLGPLLGLLCGQPQNGIILGLVCELFSQDDLPVGGRLPLNATIAVSAAFLLSWGSRAVPPEAALPAGLATGWLHQHLEARLRLRRRALSGCAETGILRGAMPPLGRMITKALAEQAAGNLAIMLGVVFLIGPTLHWLWPYAPRSVAEGLRFAWDAAPWLGLAVLLHTLRAAP